MDFTTLMVIFVGFTSITVLINTAMMVVSYKILSKATGKVTEAVRQFEAKKEIRIWVTSMEKMSAQAASMTETAKVKLADSGPMLDQMQARYEHMLAVIDTKIDDLSTSITETANRVRDAASQPAEKFDRAAAAIHNAFSFLGPSPGKEPRQ
jgi:hypothetical protein